MKSPDENRFKVLNEFCRDIAWHPSESGRWFAFCELARERRNGIHSFVARRLGTIREFREALIEYEALLTSIDASLPYP